MSMFGRTDWTKGFPFSPSRLREAGRPAAAPGRARITRADILDDGAPLALPPRPAAAEDMPARAAQALPDALRLRGAPPSRRFAPRRASLRLLPLGSFCWGSRTTPPQPRTRPDHVLVWVTAGRLRLDLPRQAIQMSAGDIRYIPAGTAFAALPQAGTEGHALLLSPEMTAGLEPPLPARHFAGAAGAQAEALALNLTELAEEAARGADPKALLCLLNMLSLRLGRLAPERAAEDDPALPPDLPLVERFLGLAAQDLSACRTLADLAQDLGTTLTALDRACRSARGRRAVDLVNELRLERAAEMLRHSDAPSARIAQELGYSSQAHFARAFVAATGRTPDVFRAQRG